MEVGEYCRNREGLIFKVDKEKKNIDINEFLNMGGNRDIIKHSKDIIDLVEVRDYVNGHLVLEKYQRPYDGQWQVDCGDVRYEDNDIKTILTHELYEQNCYKVGVENE